LCPPIVIFPLLCDADSERLLLSWARATGLLDDDACAFRLWQVHDDTRVVVVVVVGLGAAAAPRRW